MKVKDISHHPFNSEVYKLSDIDTLSESIRKVGLLEPLILNSKNQVISGNRRLEAIRNLGIEDVEVVIKDIPEDHCKIDFRMGFGEG